MSDQMTYWWLINRHDASCVPNLLYGKLHQTIIRVPGQDIDF